MVVRHVVFSLSGLVEPAYPSSLTSERSPATRTSCLPLRARGTPLSNRHGLLPYRVASPPAPASRTVVVGCTSAVQAEFHGCWQYLAVVRQSRKVRLSVSGERVTPVKVAVFFHAAQLEARCCRVECGRYGGSDLRCGLTRRDDNAILFGNSNWTITSGKTGSSQLRKNCWDEDTHRKTILSLGMPRPLRKSFRRRLPRFP